MNRAKSIFIVLYMMVLMIGVADGGYLLSMTHRFIIGGSLLASALWQLGFFLRLFLMPTARTGHLRVWIAMSFVLAIPALQVMITHHDGIGFAGGAIFAGAMPLLYVYWYSRFEHRESHRLQHGYQLPAFSLMDHQGRVLSTQALTEKRAMWLFYRGNWCPLCMAQIREVATSYQELAKRGVAIYLVSPQPPEHTAELAQKFDVPMQFLLDQDNAAARVLGILAENGLPMGLQIQGYDSDVPMPTVLITEIGGGLIYADLTDNYRIRPEPKDILDELDRWDQCVRANGQALPGANQG